MNRVALETAAAFGDSAALRGNFLDGGELAASTVKAGVKSADQVAYEARQAEAKRVADARRIEEQRQRDNAKATAERKREQLIDRAIEKNLLATDPHYAALYKKQHSAGIDLGLIPMGAKVLATGAAVIASGGAVAGALGVTAAGGAIGASVAADRVLAAVDQGGKVAETAKAVISDAKTAAAAGNINAKAAVGVLADVAKERVDKLVPPGVEQALSEAGKQAVGALTAAAGSPAASAIVASVAAGGSGMKAPALPPAKPAAPLTTRRQSVISTKARPTITLKPAIVEWFVSSAGKVTRGAVTVGKGFRVYSDGKVQKQ